MADTSKTGREKSPKTAGKSRNLEALASELHDERDALRDTFDVIEEALLLFDSSGRLQLENAAGKTFREALTRPTLRGPTPPNALDLPHPGPLHVRDGEPDTEPNSPADEAMRLLVHEAIADGVRCERSIAHDGRQFLVRAYPAAGKRALVQARDVTEERGSEVRRLQAEKLASIGMMAAGIAHEINNPASFVLANIDAMSTLLRQIEEKLNGAPDLARRLGLRDLMFEAMTVMQESKEGMARIHRIVRDLHSFSRVDDDPAAITDVNTAVESALAMLRNELRYRATVERDLRATRTVRASSARLGQVFMNLIINAAHAMADGSPARNRLWVRTFDDGDDVVVEIEDNGPGIPAEIMPQIFESFFTTKALGVGTGLGLPISRDIVRSIGGKITATSESGRGALFRTRLPALSEVSGQSRAPVRPTLGFRRRRILAIDDEALLLKAYRRMLIDHHDVEVRLGARDALALFGTDRGFDIVLCDLQMPDMSGAELFGEVKARWPEFAGRFIFITGGAFSPEARKFLDEAAPPAINKPFYVNELLELIERRVSAIAAPR